MSIRNFSEELEYGVAKGVDSTNPLSMLQIGYVRQALNANLGATGGFEKRGGFTKVLTTPWDSLAIRNGVEYKKSDGNTAKLFFGTDDSADGRIGKENVGGGVDDILTGIDATKRVSFVQVTDHLYGFNEDSTSMPFVYFGGTDVRQFGVDAPTSTPTLSNAGTGATLEAGEYIAAYTYVLKQNTTGRVIAESSPILSAEFTLSTAGKLRISNLADSPLTELAGETLSIRIYRTVVNGSVLFLAKDELLRSTTTFDFDRVDAELFPQQLQLDNTRLNSYTDYQKARFAFRARNRIFLASELLNELRFSKLGQDGPLAESFPVDHVTSVDGTRGAGDNMIGGGQIKGIPIILKERSIGILEEVGLPDITQAEDNVAYLYRELSDSIGAVSHYAQTQVYDELVFLSRDNIYATNGGSIRPIANFISATIKALDFRTTKRSKLSMVNDTKNNRILLSCFQDLTDTQPNLILVGDYQQYPEFRWTFYSPGVTTSTHPGIKPGSFFQFTNISDGSQDVYFGNTVGNGQYYQMNSGDSDTDYSTDLANKGIFFKIISRPYAMSQPLLTKLYNNVKIFAQAENDTYQLEFCSIYDLSQEEELCEDFTIPGVGGKWENDATSPDYGWTDDDGGIPVVGPPDQADTPLIWAGPTLAELQYDPHRKAKFMQLVFNQFDAEAPVTIMGWGVSASLFGPN